MNNHKNRSTQRGITLIEMMIAMVVSLVLVAGVGTVYVSSKRNYAARDELATLNDSARVALETLRHHLEHAGYATPSHLPIGRYFYVQGDTDPQAGTCGTGTFGTNSLGAIKKTATADGGGLNGSDTITVRFIADQTLNIDALNSQFNKGVDGCYGGQSSIKDSLTYNGFLIGTDGSTRDSTGNLIPILYAAGSNSNLPIRPVVNGIENMQFMYGIDVDGNDTADRFVNAAGVGGNWESVVSIKVALLVRSMQPVQDTASSRTFNLLDTTYTTPSDRFQRAVYTAVIQLRNVVEG